MHFRQTLLACRIRLALGHATFHADDGGTTDALLDAAGILRAGLYLRKPGAARRIRQAADAIDVWLDAEVVTNPVRIPVMGRAVVGGISVLRKGAGFCLCDLFCRCASDERKEGDQSVDYFHNAPITSHTVPPIARRRAPS